jgi:predicted metalloprotease
MIGHWIVPARILANPENSRDNAILPRVTRVGLRLQRKQVARRGIPYRINLKENIFVQSILILAELDLCRRNLSRGGRREDGRN